jgi:hypothetical protein
MYLNKFVQNETGRNIMSIILGLGLATFFRKMCDGKDCIVSKAPPYEEIDDKIYKFDDKCYKLENKAETCNIQKQIVSFA